MSDAAMARRRVTTPLRAPETGTPPHDRGAAKRYFLTTMNDCPAAGGACLPGCAALQRLMAAMSLALPLTGPELALSGTIEVPDCAAACGAPCRLAWQADAAGLSLLGGLGAQDDPAAALAGALAGARRGVEAPALLHAERASALLA